MNPTETASGSRQSPFPPEWGRPPGTQYSEERSAWIARNVQETAATSRHRQLGRRDTALACALRLMYLNHRSEP
jgi:hypothetical protein